MNSTMDRPVRAFVCVRGGNERAERGGHIKILDGVREKRRRCCFPLSLKRLRVPEEEWPLALGPWALFWPLQHHVLVIRCHR